MISIEQALEIVREQAKTSDSQLMLVEQAADLVLAAPVQAKCDVPPHDKAMMDGYALRSCDWTPDKQLKVIGRISAGQSPQFSVDLFTAIQIMTGAPIPPGANCVEMFERCLEFDQQGNPHSDRSVLPESVQLKHEVRADQNIMRQGHVMRVGERLFTTGHLLSPIDIGLIIDSGNANVETIRNPKVAVLATGDELLEPGEELSAGKIFNSNGPMISAMARRTGATVHHLGVGKDDQTSLRWLIEQGLESDVLILTGGVSAGVLDLVPAVLAEAEVEKMFHKVQLKPGKPIWFGVKRHHDRNTLVFGLPGNPVSSIVCFQLFVKPAINWLAGRNHQTGLSSATLDAEHLQRGDRPTYWPATVTRELNHPTITPLSWKGSSDLRTIAAANSLALFPAGDRQFLIGDEVQFTLLD